MQEDTETENNKVSCVTSESTAACRGIMSSVFPAGINKPDFANIGTKHERIAIGATISARFGVDIPFFLRYRN